MQLEERLGVRLLNRSTRRLDATPLGERYYQNALRLLDEVQLLEQAISGQTVELRGTLRLNAPLSFAIAHLGCRLTKFLQLHPGVDVEVDLSDRAVDLIGGGYDLALRIGILEDSSLVARRIGAVERVHCASPAYLAAHGTWHVAGAGAEARARLPVLRACAAGAVAVQGGGQGHQHRRERAHARQQWRDAQGCGGGGDGHHLPADLHRRQGPG
jgi:DNA-binding transcriptional LysR family regulator